MPVDVGATAISKLFLGSTALSKLYVGSALAWQAGPSVLLGSVAAGVGNNVLSTTWNHAVEADAAYMIIDVHLNYTGTLSGVAVKVNNVAVPIGLNHGMSTTHGLLSFAYAIPAGIKGVTVPVNVTITGTTNRVYIGSSTTYRMCSSVGGFTSSQVTSGSSLSSPTVIANTNSVVHCAWAADSTLGGAAFNSTTTDPDLTIAFTRGSVTTNEGALAIGVGNGKASPGKAYGPATLTGTFFLACNAIPVLA